MPLFWCLIGLGASSRGSARWTVSGCPTNPGGDGRHRWAGKERTGGSGNICSRGMPCHRHQQVEETHEEETSIPQVGWSWTIPRVESIPILQYQLLSDPTEVIGESHIQSQKRGEIENPCKHWISRLVLQRKTNQTDTPTLISTLHPPVSGF